MPKQAFFKLNEAKQQAIMTAAFAEFKQYPFAEASINRMIKQAKISRGSFYLYFADKEDIYHYLMEQLLTLPFYQQLDQAMAGKKTNIFDFTGQCFVILATIMKERTLFWQQILQHSTAQQLGQLFCFKRHDKELFEQYHLSQDHLRFKAVPEQRMLRYTLRSLLYHYLLQVCKGEEIESTRSLLLKHMATFKIGWQ